MAAGLLPSPCWSLPSTFADSYRRFGEWTKEGKVPVVYNSIYNIRFLGLENLHPFDSKKYQRIMGQLGSRGVLAEGQLVASEEATMEVLEDVHSKEYLGKLHSSSLKVAQVTELAPLVMLPNSLVQWKVMKPMRYMVAGTILAAGLAAQHGWAINMGGGMHHASFNDGQGWCAYSDIYLAVRQLRRASENCIQNVLYIDLDVHQGNGVGRDKMHLKDKHMFILDMYNYQIYPGDTPAKAAIDIKVELASGTRDSLYLAKLKPALAEAFESYQIDFVFYNAGTDVYELDPLGHLAVSQQGIVARDELVWRAALEREVPICMVLSGGYARQNYKVISASLENLVAKFQLVGG